MLLPSKSLPASWERTYVMLDNRAAHPTTYILASGGLPVNSVGVCRVRSGIAKTRIDLQD
jgi:hypothetical protein